MKRRFTDRISCALAVVLLVAGAQVGFGQSIPKVSGLADDRWNFDSPLWEQAGEVDEFKVPSAAGEPPVAAEQATEVRLAHDGEYLFVRFTAFDDAIDQVRADEPDPFGQELPSGDRGEIWVSSHELLVLAFDPNGNKYDAHNFNRRHFTGLQVKSRIGADRWESIAVVPIKSLFWRDVGNRVQLAFVRHLDHGAEQPERSTAGGQSPTRRAHYTLE